MPKNRHFFHGTELAYIVFQRFGKGERLMPQGDPYGIHRSLEPKGALPQPAWRIDNTMRCYDNEILIDVETLNIDSASFEQIRQEAGDDPPRIAQIMQRIVAERGKHHNPATGSGGMLIGKAAQIGDSLRDRTDLQTGDRIATLVSLSLTPLVIDEILQMDRKSGQVDIRGQAILFETGLYAKLPDDLPLKVSLAALDVCGAPAQSKKMVQPGQQVVVLGASGKSGLLVLKQARDNLGPKRESAERIGRLIAIDRGAAACERLRQLDWADEVLDLDATDPIAVMRAVADVTSGQMADLTINCVNVPGTEMASILATRDAGTVYFFSMATSFTAAALGAEGAGKDVTMLIGSGYTKGHAELALQLVRNTPQLRAIFTERYGR
jgi:L-erythro-3,5-diaminohexanoate dehydrogenase